MTMTEIMDNLSNLNIALGIAILIFLYLGISLIWNKIRGRPPAKDDNLPPF